MAKPPRATSAIASVVALVAAPVTGSWRCRGVGALGVGTGTVDGVADGVVTGVGVVDGVGVGTGVTDGVVDGLGVGLGDADGAGVGVTGVDVDGLGVGVGLGDADGVGTGVGVADGVTDGVGVGLVDGLGAGADGLGLGAGVGVGAGLGVGSGVGTTGLVSNPALPPDSLRIIWALTSQDLSWDVILATSRHGPGSVALTLTLIWKRAFSPLSNLTEIVALSLEQLAISGSMYRVYIG